MHTAFMHLYENKLAVEVTYVGAIDAIDLCTILNYVGRILSNRYTCVRTYD